MRTFLFRRIRRAAVPVASFAALSSFTFADSFVLSGEYEHVRALAADCAQSYIPAMGHRTDQAASLFRFASYTGGSELASTYRALPLDASAFRVVDDAPNEASSAAGERRAVYETENFAISSTAVETARGCMRVYVSTTTPVLPIGMHDGGLGTQNKFKDLTDIRPAGWDGSVRFQNIDPDRIKGTVEILVLKDGQPQPDVDVQVHAVGRGNPGRYGQTPGHTHLQKASTPPAPSLRFSTAPLSGNPKTVYKTVTTDANGKASLDIYPWHRGGPETVIARAQIDGQSVVGERVIVLRHRRFVHFAHALGFQTVPPRGERYPFVMTGYTDNHQFNHYVQEGVGSRIAEVMRSVWAQDMYRDSVAKAHTLLGKPANFYFALNDMSLEYGGRFVINAGSSCTIKTGGSHATHRNGLDFDVSPCYTNSNGQNVGATACQSDQTSGRRNFLHVDERVLAAHVIGRMGGAIHEHRTVAHGGIPSDGTPYHYHIRFPEPPAPSSTQRDPGV